jgi:hypothetical protein
MNSEMNFMQAARELELVGVTVPSFLLQTIASPASMYS